MRYVLLLMVATLHACALPVSEAPAPQQLTTTHAPDAVVSIAASVLAADGFEATTADAAGGILVARREWRGAAAKQAHHCVWPAGSIGERNLVATQTVTVTARAAGEGSAVTIASRTVSQSVGVRRPAETECVSNGSVEERVSTALAVDP